MVWGYLGADKTTGALPAKVAGWIAGQLNNPSTIIGAVISNVSVAARDRDNHTGKQAPSTIDGVTATGAALMTAATADKARESIAAAAATDTAGRLRPRGPWAAGQAYAVNDVVISGAGTYYALLAHTAANPAPTATSKYWQALGSAASSTFTPSYANAQPGAVFFVKAPFPAARPTDRTDVAFILRSTAAVATPTWVIQDTDTHIVVG